MSLWWPPSISERPVEHGLLDFALAFQRDLFFFWSSHLYMGGGWKVKAQSSLHPNTFLLLHDDDNDVVRGHLLLKSSQMSLEQQQLNTTCTMLYSKYYKVDVNKFQVCFGFLFKCPPLSVLVCCLLSRCCQHLSLGTCAIKWLTWWNVEEGSFIAIFIPWGALCLLLFLRRIILTRLWSKRYLNVISIKKKGDILVILTILALASS